ncbi:MAG: hypothetical protein Q8P84_00120, partial [Deltaproteobacteria bacterium]|nr:hypothetical protein [Deltaproteobacteria bacterium]
GILGSKHNGVPHPIQAAANFMSDLNAYYSPGEDRLAFGRGNDKWHLASDGDVAVHEGGHLFLDHINPGLGGWGRHEGGAIHEGFGDALAALFFKDGEMSEDFVPQVGRRPSKDDGLRIVRNDLTLSEAGEEVHDRGRVYAGFFWSLYETFIEKGGLQEEEARALTLRLLLNHAAHYRTSRPQPDDFADAVILGAKALSREQKLSLPLGAVTEMIESEAKRRGLRSEGSQKPTPKKRPYPLSVEKAQQYYIRNSGGVVDFSPVSSAPYIGGVFVTYQQRYFTTLYGPVDVIGHGMQARLNANGKATAILDADVRPMQAGEINETTLIPFADALTKVYDFLSAQLTADQRRLRTIETGFRQTQEMIYKWKDLSGRVLVFELCRQQFTKSPPQQPKYVVLNHDTELSYEINLGSAVFYVNAQTGIVQFAKKIFF